MINNLCQQHIQNYSNNWFKIIKSQHWNTVAFFVSYDWLY